MSETKGKGETEVNLSGGNRNGNGPKGKRNGSPQKDPAISEMGRKI